MSSSTDLDLVDDGVGSMSSNDAALTGTNHSVAEDYYLRQLIDPDLLWHRLPRAGHFRSIGSVDSLGRFSIDKDLQKYLIRHAAALQTSKTGNKQPSTQAAGATLTRNNSSVRKASSETPKMSRRTTSGYTLPDDFTEKAYHVQTQQVPDANQADGRFARVFKK